MEERLGRNYIICILNYKYSVSAKHYIYIIETSTAYKILDSYTIFLLIK